MDAGWCIASCRSVEDDRLVLQMFAMDVEDAGYHVLVAKSGDMAMRICADTRPDFALLDMNLPDMSGLDLARWINAALDVPFLFLTAVDEETVSLARPIWARLDIWSNH